MGVGVGVVWVDMGGRGSAFACVGGRVGAFVSGLVKHFLWLILALNTFKNAKKITFLRFNLPQAASEFFYFFGFSAFFSLQIFRYFRKQIPVCSFFIQFSKFWYQIVRKSIGNKNL